MQEIKENFKKIIIGLSYESGFEECLLKMIDQYTGENPGDFFETVSKLMMLLANHRELTVKAEAYDKIMSIEKEYNDTLEKLKKEYEQIQSSEQAGDSMALFSQPDNS
ncbi:MAG: hypothetical protein WC243_01725 [Patescibacteria group bacterium]